jgi:hypothetical protein
MKPLDAFRTGEGTPGGPGAHNVDPTAALRLGVLMAAETIADERLLPVAAPQVIAGESYDS